MERFAEADRSGGGNLMQEIDERDEFGTCLACGAVIESTVDRSFVFGTGNELCSACAIARGGAYIVDRDVWDPPPDVTGLHGEELGIPRSPRET
jgi:hypothetical protein